MPAGVGVSTKVDTCRVVPAAGRVELRFDRSQPRESPAQRPSVSTRCDYLPSMELGSNEGRTLPAVRRRVIQPLPGPRP